MASFTDEIDAALAHIDHAGDLVALLKNPAGSLVEAATAWAKVLGDSPDVFAARRRLAGRLEVAVAAMNRDAELAMLGFEQQLARALTGRFEAQQQTAWIVLSEFGSVGWGGPNSLFVLGDPATLPPGSPWQQLISVDQLFEGRWLVLGTGRQVETGVIPVMRPLYRAGQATTLTSQFESKRRADEAERQRQLDAEADADAQRRAWESSSPGQIAALKAQLARLKAGQAV